MTISGLVTHPLLWRIIGFCSSIVGFTCYALSPSFRDLFGHWNHLKIAIYFLTSSFLSLSVLLVKRFRHCRNFLLKAQVVFMVLTLTSLYSFLAEQSVKKVNHNNKGRSTSYGNAMNLTSSAAFALMALSLSRLLQLGFEVGVTNFLLGCFLMTVMKMNIKLAPVAAFFCYLLVNIRSFFDYLLEMGGNTGGHVDDNGGGSDIIVDHDSYNELTHRAVNESSSSNNQNNTEEEEDDDGRETLTSSLLEVRVDPNNTNYTREISMEMWAYNCPVCKF